LARGGGRGRHRRPVRDRRHVVAVATLAVAVGRQVVMGRGRRAGRRGTARRRCGCARVSRRVAAFTVRVVGVNERGRRFRSGHRRSGGISRRSGVRARGCYWVSPGWRRGWNSGRCPGDGRHAVNMARGAVLITGHLPVHGGARGLRRGSVGRSRTRGHGGRGQRSRRRFRSGCGHFRRRGRFNSCRRLFRRRRCFRRYGHVWSRGNGGRFFRGGRGAGNQWFRY
jgi:hypothetical protein